MRSRVSSESFFPDEFLPRGSVGAGKGHPHENWTLPGFAHIECFTDQILTHHTGEIMTLGDPAHVAIWVFLSSDGPDRGVLRTTQLYDRMFVPGFEGEVGTPPPRCTVEPGEN